MSLQPDKPLMVMEFWSGWFDHWGDPHLARNIEPHDLAATLHTILSAGASINFYMFHGALNLHCTFVLCTQSCTYVSQNISVKNT